MLVNPPMSWLCVHVHMPVTLQTTTKPTRQKNPLFPRVKPT